MVSICCPSRANSQNHLSDSRDLLQEEGGSSQHNGNITALTRPTPRIINLLKGTEWLSHTLPTLSPPRPAHLTAGGTLKFLFFPCRAELPSLRQIFVELLPSCAPSASQEHKRFLQRCFPGSLCHTSGKGRGREEQPESREQFPWAFQSALEPFIVFQSKQAEQGSWAVPEVAVTGLQCQALRLFLFWIKTQTLTKLLTILLF